MKFWIFSICCAAWVFFPSCTTNKEPAPESKIPQRDTTTKNYSGTAFRGDRYACSLAIKPDSSIIFIGQTEDGAIYFENKGTIEQVKDSIYLIRTFKDFFAGPMEDHFPNDSVFFHCDSTLAIGVINVIYADSSRKNISLKNSRCLIPFNKALRSKNENLWLDIGHVNPITKKPVLFSAWYGSMYNISVGNYSEYYFVILRSNIIQSINAFPGQVGPLRLELVKNKPTREKKEQVHEGTIYRRYISY